MIRAEALGKRFPGRRGPVDALAGLTMTCGAGEIYALLGPNGAGKTTLLRILATLMEPTTGDAWIDGQSVRTAKAAVRSRIGVVSYETGVYDRMTPREIGTFFGLINDLDPMEIERRLSEIFGLLRMEDFADTRTDDFSTGMKQKTVLMRALITHPQILVFDEPTSGLDVLTAKRVLDYIRLLKQNGKTVLFSTHLLWEAESLADRIGIIHRGRLALEGTLADLRAATGHTRLEDIFFSIAEDPS